MATAQRLHTIHVLVRPSGELASIRFHSKLSISVICVLKLDKLWKQFFVEIQFSIE